jgi:hypothetical protein
VAKKVRERIVPPTWLHHDLSPGWYAEFRCTLTSGRVRRPAQHRASNCTAAAKRGSCTLEPRELLPNLESRKYT